MNLCRFFRELFSFTADPDDFEPSDCRVCGEAIEGPIGPGRDRQVLNGAHDRCLQGAERMKESPE